MSASRPKPPWRPPSIGSLLVYATLLVIGLCLLLVGPHSVHGWGVTLALIAVGIFVLDTLNANRRRWQGPEA